MADKRLIPVGIRDTNTEALNELIERLGILDITPILVYLIDNVAVSALPHLAEQFHVAGGEGWLLTQTEAERRNLIKKSIELHRYKGTPWAVKEAIKALGYFDISIQERLPVVTYNNLATYSGSEDFGAGSRWALFKVLIDIGETKSLTRDDITRLTDAINEWKNARSKLKEITFSATITDTTTVSEVQETMVQAITTDVTPWGQRYDGSARYNNAQRRLYDSLLKFDGLADWSGFIATGSRYDNQYEDLAVALGVGLVDQAHITPFFNGKFYYSGFNYGAETPPVIDSGMSISIRREIRYNSKRMFGGINQYNGALRFDGTKRFFEGIYYAGDMVTTEVVL